MTWEESNSFSNLQLSGLRQLQLQLILHGNIASDNNGIASTAFFHNQPASHEQLYTLHSPLIALQAAYTSTIPTAAAINLLNQSNM